MNIEVLKSAAAQFKTAFQSHDRTGLVSASRILLTHNAPLGSQWLGAAQQLMRWGEANLALKAFDQWKAQAAPPHAAAHEKAVLLAKIGRSAEARDLLDAVPDTKPSTVANAYLKAAIATNLAEVDEAERQFRRAIASEKRSGRSWLGLTQLGRITSEDEREIAQVASLDDLETVDAAAIYHSLGLLAQSKNDYDTAFDNFERSTKILQSSHRYNAKDNAQSAAIAMKWATSHIGHSAPPSGDAQRQPIFVSGLARSGTTLVSEILSAHSQVDGASELGLSVQLEATVGGFSPDDFSRYVDQGGSLDDLRSLYLRLVDERLPGKGRFVDKSLNQSRSIGPLAMLFPKAPILWLKRDPLDNALSIYRSWLANNVVGSWSLADIADHMKIEDRLLAHWKNVVGDRLLEVPYGELVENPELWTEKITNHCGLVPEPSQLEFHTGNRSVTTASALQVREPINRKGLGVAEPYAHRLDEFTTAYFG